MHFQIYTEVTGFNVDRTWQLQEERNRPAQWSYVFDKAYIPLDDEDDRSDFSEDWEKQALVLHRDRKKLGKASGVGGAVVKGKKGGAHGGKKRKALTSGQEVGHDSDAEDSDMPELLSVSASSGSCQKAWQVNVGCNWAYLSCIQIPRLQTMTRTKKMMTMKAGKTKAGTTRKKRRSSSACSRR